MKRYVNKLEKQEKLEVSDGAEDLLENENISQAFAYIFGQLHITAAITVKCNQNKDGNFRISFHALILFHSLFNACLNVCILLPYFLS